MNYIIIWILLFIILASITIDIASYGFLGEESFQENIDSMLPLRICPDKWKQLTNEANSITCLVPEIRDTFDANSVNGCVLWLDANDLSTFKESNGRVNTWYDKSSSKYIFKGDMSISNYCPSKMQMTNGKYYLNFSSANTQTLSIYKPTGFNIANKNFAMFVVCKMVSDNGTIFSRGSKYDDKIVFPGSIFIQNVNSKLNATIHNESGIGKPLQNSILNKWMILSLICSKDSSGKLYINGIKQESEFKPLKYDFTNNYSMVIGGATDPIGYTMKDMSDCEYVKSQRKVKLQRTEYDNITVTTENCIVKERDYDILYIFKQNGTIKFSCKNDCNSISVPVSTLMVGGGGGGGYAKGAMEGSGGGGSGGVSLNLFYGNMDQTYKIKIGTGGTSGTNGNPTIIELNSYRSMCTAGGGRGGIGNGGSTSTGVNTNNNTCDSGSGGGGQGWASMHLGGSPNNVPNAISGGTGSWLAGGGGGGGATSTGTHTLKGQADGGHGGEGYTWWVDSMTYARGGGGGQSYMSNGKPGLPNGGLLRQSGKDGVNPGDGGGGSGAYAGDGGRGQDGIVILRIKKYDMRYSYIKTYEDIETYYPYVCKPERKQVPVELNQSQYFDGDIAEIITYISDDDSCIQKRSNIEESLAIKWGLTKIPEFSQNENIKNAKSLINIGKKDIGYIGYNQNTSKFENIDGTGIPEVWSYDDNSKSYKIDFTSPGWNAANGDTLKNACEWAKTNNILWDEISKDCQEQYKINLLSN